MGIDGNVRPPRPPNGDPWASLNEADEQTANEYLLASTMSELEVVLKRVGVDFHTLVAFYELRMLVDERKGEANGSE